MAVIHTIADAAIGLFLIWYFLPKLLNELRDRKVKRNRAAEDSNDGIH